MEFKLTKEQKRLKKDHVCFAQEQLRDETFAERDQAGRFSRALWAKCGEAGLTGLHVPEAYGGRGYDALNMALAFEGLGYGTEDQGLPFSFRCSSACAICTRGPFPGPPSTMRCFAGRRRTSTCRSS
jgi:alkylation response protein AidB-like acyl-CoA dehydrogenase